MQELFSHAAPVFPVEDVLASAHWYEEKLGFSIEFLWEEPPSYAVMRRGEGVNLHLSLHENLDPDRLKALFYIFVHDADAVYAEFMARDVPIEAEISDTDYGMREFSILDPNGYKLVFGKNVTH